MPKIANEETYHKLVATLDGDDPITIRNKAMITMLWDTGARAGEFCSINCADVDAIKRRIHIRTAKSRGLNPMRSIFWTEETNTNLLRWLDIRKTLKANDDALWVRIGSRKGGRIDKGGFSHLVRMMCTKAGLPVMNPHAFRHAFGREMAKKGANNSVISSMLGHSNINSSKIYTTLYGNDLQEAYQKMRG